MLRQWHHSTLHQASRNSSARRGQQRYKAASLICWPCRDLPSFSPSSTCFHRLPACQAGLRLQTQKVLSGDLLFVHHSCWHQTGAAMHLSAKITKSSPPSTAVSVYATNLSRRRCRQLAQRTDARHLQPDTFYTGHQ